MLPTNNGTQEHPSSQYEQQSIYKPFCGKGINESNLFQLLQIQKQCNLQLIRNQKYIEQYLTTRQTNYNSKNGHSIDISTSDGIINKIKAHPEDLDGLNNKVKTVTSSNSSKSQPKIGLNNNRVRSQKTQRSKLQEQDSQYNPQLENLQILNSSRTSQSKNVPKNISKAIFLFIKKKKCIIDALLEKMNIDKDQFLNEVTQMKGKINTITELRALWMDQQNKNAKIYRILSNYYLKKHSLHHIFNSRVIQYQKNLKYRQKIIQALKNPSDFTHMKDY